MQRTYTPLRIGVAIAGFIVIATDTTLNVANQLKEAGGLSDTVVATVVVAVATLLASFVIGDGIRKSEYGHIPFVASFLLIGTTFSFIQSIDRTSTQQHTYLMQRAVEMGQSMQQASPHLQEARAIEREIDRSGLRAIVAQECRTDSVVYDPDIHSVANFPNCDPAYRRLAALERQREGYMRLAAQESSPRLWEVDMAAASLALGVPLSQQTISIYKPWLLPLALLLGGFSLFTWGVSGERPEFGAGDLALSGSAAATAKAERYMQAFKAETGQWPSKADVAKAVGITPDKAETIRKRVMQRARKRN